ENNTYNNFDLEETKFVSVPSIAGPLNILKNKSAVSKIVKEELEKADALIARLPSETGNIAIQQAKKMNKPYLVEVVGCVWDSLWNYGSIQAKLYAPIAMKKMKKNVENAPYVIYVTNKFLQKRYPTKGKTENISNVEIGDVSQNSLETR